MVKLNPPKSLNRLQEIFQVTDIKFSFIVQKKEDEFDQITTPMKCREYFNEFLMKNHHPKEFYFKSTHGFEYNWAEHPWDTQTTYLSMNFPNEELMNKFLDNLPFLHKVEELNKIPLTTVKPTNKKNTIIVLGDAFWNSKCILMNIYSWILKLCSIGANELSQKELRKAWGQAKEVEYLENLTNTSFNNLIAHLRDIYNVTTKYVDGTNKINPDNYVIHNSRGIMHILYWVQASEKHADFVPDFIEMFKKILLVTKPDTVLLKAS